MIVVTVGTQLPFDRLVMAMDAIAPAIKEPIFAQIGLGAYIPTNFEYCRLAPPAELNERFEQASSIVSHAGTGSLLAARRFGKPIILFPRRATQGEHRNEHQLATCKQVEGTPGVLVAYDEDQLAKMLQWQFDRREPTLSNAEPGSPLGRRIARYFREIRG